MNQKLNCIMLIDDDEPTTFLGNMIIEEAVCTEHIQIENGGKKAIDYLANSRKRGSTNEDNPWPDLILLDINMPAMNGWEFLVEYDRLEKDLMPEIVVVMLTTSLDPSDGQKAKNMPGINDFKHKPLTKEMLQEILQKFFPDHFQPIGAMETLAKE